MAKIDSEKTAIYLCTLADPVRRKMMRMLTDPRKNSQTPGEHSQEKEEVAGVLEIVKAVDQAMIRRRQKGHPYFFENEDFLEQCLETALNLSSNFRRKEYDD